MAQTLRLIGGRFDGVRLDLGYEPEPEFLHVFRCPDCGDTHHLTPEHVAQFEDRDRNQDETVYRLLKVDGDEAVYIERALPAKPWKPEESETADELVPMAGARAMTRDAHGAWHEIGRITRFDYYHARLGVIRVSGIL